MSQRIDRAHNTASSYKEYRKELESYLSSSDLLLIPGCNDFHSQHIKGSIYDDPTVCAVAVKFLSHLKEKNIPSYEEEGCKYFFYWLYTKALDGKKHIEDTLDLYKKLNELFNEENDGHHKFDKYINNMNKDTCDKLQKVIHLYEVFNKLENEVSQQSEQTKCISNCSELFTSYVDECREAYNYDFCNGLKDFREYHNYYFQSILHCKEEQYLLPQVEIYHIGGIILTPFVVILVTAFIFPIIYKFTAFGPWIHHILRRKKNIWENINQETNQSLNLYEMENRNSKIQSYNIAYNCS
ncbi:Plasmodium vivax Vir protein, putative [Plasmodium ovale]|uniref:Plasmodium vivax Vir protein, putative n=1 Tax=Plasmodium ovale TaxID=36330 RepID=A0A1C3KKH7_PLAOA|nr:Plasmodium vivax Vir protein, putative [Plasmodium ovale]